MQLIGLLNTLMFAFLPIHLLFLPLEYQLHILFDPFLLFSVLFGFSNLIILLLLLIQSLARVLADQALPSTP